MQQYRADAPDGRIVHACVRIGDSALFLNDEAPHWGVLGPNESVGEYATRDEYLLLVFDHRGRPHTQRFGVDEIARLQTDESRASEQFRSLIESFCATRRAIP